MCWWSLTGKSNFVTFWISRRSIATWKTRSRRSKPTSEKRLIHPRVDGIAVINSMRKGGSWSDVQEGEEVRRVFASLQVVNPGQMQVRARVSQADIEDLQVGQTARIHLDAYPELFFSGRVERIAAVAQTSAFNNKVRVFTVLFHISGSDAKLLPDLSAAVDVELDREPHVLVAPRETILRDKERTHVRGKSGTRYQKREVQMGNANDLEQIILSGVEKGAVLLRNPSS